MEDQLTTLETSKLAREKGFDIRCENAWYYTQNGGNAFKVNATRQQIPFGYYENTDTNVIPTDESGPLYITAPTQSLLQRWLREKHDIHIVVFRGYSTVVYKDYQDWLYHNWDFGTYEEALEAALFEALKLLQYEQIN